MFSQNGRISEKQMRRMLVLPVYTGLVFVMPYLAAVLFEDSIWQGLLVFFGVAVLYIACVDWLGMGRGCSRQRGLTTARERIFLIVQLIRWMVRLVFYICMTIEILKEGQVPFMPEDTGDRGMDVWVLVPLLLVCLYGAGGNRQKHGMEKQVRIYEWIFWLIYIPFLIVLIFGLKKMDLDIFLTRGKIPVRMLLVRSLVFLPFLFPAENVVFLAPHLQPASPRKKMQEGKRIFGGCVGTILFVCVLSMIMLGIYGVRGAAEEEMLTVSIMRYIRLPFGVIERVDALLVWFFVIGCFVLLSQTLFYMGMAFSKLFGVEKCGWMLAGVVLLALIIVMFLPEYRCVVRMYGSYAAIPGVGLSVLLCLWGRGILKKEE